MVKLIQRVVIVVIVAFVLFCVFAWPENSAQTVHNFIGAFDPVVRFFKALFTPGP